jgi:hypothetical protein
MERSHKGKNYFKKQRKKGKHKSQNRGSEMGGKL